MASTPYTLTPAWSATNRYTASGATDVRLGNRSAVYPMYFTITNSDTLPAIEVTEGSPLAPLDAEAMQLADGERLWMAADPRGLATIEV